MPAMQPSTADMWPSTSFTAGTSIAPVECAILLHRPRIRRILAQKKQAITCSLPMNAKGLSLWSRKPFEREAKSEFDAPLAWRYDETDSMVMCDQSDSPFAFIG